MPPSFVIVEADRLRAGMIRHAMQQVFPDAQIKMAQGILDADTSIAREKPDLLVVGTEGQNADVIDYLFKWLGQPQPAIRVLVIAGRKDERLLTALNSLPLSGVFDPAAEGPEELARAIRMVVAGGRYWSSSLLQLMTAQLSNRQSVSRRLTPTQLIVFALIGAGYPDALIAEHLNVTERTVESTREDLRGILKVRRQCDLVHLAARFGFVRFAADSVEIPGYANLVSARVCRTVLQLPQKVVSAA